MASQDSSLENRISENSEQGITIGVIGLGDPIKRAVAWEFLLEFVKTDWYKWNSGNNPKIKILINNKDDSEGQARVNGYIQKELIGQAQSTDLKKMITDNIEFAYVEDIAKKANVILISYDSGINEPEIGPASRFLVQNPNLARMLKPMFFKKDPDGKKIEELDEDKKPVKDKDGNLVYVKESMADLLGRSKALKFMITNCVDYMTYFTQRHLMREYIKNNKDRNDAGKTLFELIEESSQDDKKWQFRNDLSGIPGHYLFETLRDHSDGSRNYLNFLARSWFGFAQVDIARLTDGVKDIMRTHPEILLSPEYYDIIGPFFCGEHGKFGAPALSGLKISLHNKEDLKRFPNLEFPFRKKGEVDAKGKVIKEEGMFYRYRLYPKEIIKENDIRKGKENPLHPGKSLPVIIGGHVPSMFNSEGFWPFGVLTQEITKVLMDMLNRLTYPEKASEHDLFGSLLHITDEDKAAVITLPTELELYEYKDPNHPKKASEIAVGAKLHSMFAKEVKQDKKSGVHIFDRRFNKEAESISGETVFDSRDREIFSRNLGAICRTIEDAERSELEEPNKGTAYINPLDKIVAVLDSEKEGVLLTAFNGADIPAGGIIPRLFPGTEDSEKYVTPFQEITQVSCRSHKIEVGTNVGYSRNIVLLARNTRNTKYRLVRFNLLENFTLKKSYNLKTKSEFKKGEEIQLEHEKMSYMYEDLGNDVKKIATYTEKIKKKINGEDEVIGIGKVYVLYEDRIEIRNIDTLAIRQSEKIDDRIEKPEDLKVDTRGFVFITGSHHDISDKMFVFDSDLKFHSVLNLNCHFGMSKFQEFPLKGNSSHYLFYAIPGNSKILCKDITDINKPKDIDLRMDNPEGRGIFAPGIYTNPGTKESLLYVARIIKNKTGQGTLKIEFYAKDESQGLRKKLESTLDTELPNPDNIFNIKTCDNYVIVGNRQYLLGKHTHSTKIARGWKKLIPKGDFNSIISYDIMPLEVKPDGTEFNIG